MGDAYGYLSQHSHECCQLYNIQCSCHVFLIFIMLNGNRIHQITRLSHDKLLSRKSHCIVDGIDVLILSKKMSGLGA